MAGSVLVVSEDLVEADRWARWLEGAGFLAVMCAGPRLRHDCPRVDGRPCLLREAVAAAVVADDPLQGAIDPVEPSCTRLPDDGTTIRVEGDRLVAWSGGSRTDLGPLTRQGLIGALSRVVSVQTRGRCVAASPKSRRPRGAAG
jgi:hypothetical protein